MKGKKSPKPKNMDELTQGYASSAEKGDPEKGVTQAEFEKALKTISQKKRPKDAGK